MRQHQKSICLPGSPILKPLQYSVKTVPACWNAVKKGEIDNLQTNTTKKQDDSPKTKPRKDVNVHHGCVPVHILPAREEG